MLSQDQARQRVFEEINRTCPVKDDYLDIIDALTVERPYGWFFMFDCHKLIETGNPVYSQIVGNVPIFVDRETGQLHEIAWKRSLEESVRAYETLRGADARAMDGKVDGDGKKDANY